jgi:hypothetical protein
LHDGVVIVFIVFAIDGLIAWIRGEDVYSALRGRG